MGIEKYFSIERVVIDRLITEARGDYIVRVVVRKNNEILDFEVIAYNGKIYYGNRYLSIDEFILKLASDLMFSVKEIEMFFVKYKRP